MYLMYLDGYFADRRETGSEPSLKSSVVIVCFFLHGFIRRAAHFHSVDVLAGDYNNWTTIVEVALRQVFIFKAGESDLGPGQTGAVKPSDWWQLQRDLPRPRRSLLKNNNPDPHFEGRLWTFWDQFSDIDFALPSQVDLAGAIQYLARTDGRDLSITGVGLFNIQPLPGAFGPNPPEPRPDFLDAHFIRDVRPAVLQSLRRYIAPFDPEPAEGTAPALERLGAAAPNFFLFASNRSECPNIAERMAAYTGALGTRGIELLRNFRTPERPSKGKTAAFTVVYTRPNLRLFAHHATGTVPRGPPRGRAQYHMNRLGEWNVLENHENFRKAAIMVRNAREWAK